ncbi:TPA: type IV toxin-antitoxin system AbiEi family antitoxin [Proteus mirabilis]|uniref:type IV toxin-antitoxin system AbiEi family antitoxin n=1 Tax=Proteus mirabilis TaxID=584 RepID=UPI0006673170|nr:type IV toxin-antitoxin system AbiEi family antitoxin [Proteus mirabilis]MBG2907505.1 type IV toxin-antitoxin system AbiEi family antitoxin [Proteus mirabilis]MBG2927608.1 type IV toxin-antitoxin system AbiEi family antitoxin [Proteus mirabilis]MBG3024174.1 type IV toxin-antitoxin system AbiEi family antitoxin [Proteus mirabilis]HCD1095773.1 type IV toxin-antitoxin system AbiEi family antitoxin [Proteus mirabilis]HCD1097194.1 type IV toxin-antitoxin system AbiEi family antitoxin [Proteus mi
MVSHSQCETVKESYKQSLKTLLPYGMLATKKWLTEQGLSTHALDNAVKTDTLLLLATGVYSQYSRAVTWEGVVASMQHMMEKSIDEQLPSIVVGGLSALSISGLSQYLSLGSTPHIHLYATKKLPSWLARLSLPIKFEGHSTSKLWPDSLSQDIAFVKKHEWGEQLPPVYFSCPEKAILEVLMDLPESVSFEHADELMQGLVNLSPRKLDVLLTECKSVKVKRLFFWFAKRQAYPWFDKLNVENYDLGSGKRVVAKGGKLDTEYLITVPQHMALASKG